MRNFNEFYKGIMNFGLEFIGLYYGDYRAVVVDNNDPENLGRVKVKIPQLYGDETFDKWVIQKRNGLFYVPEKGDVVFVNFEGGKTRFPIYQLGYWTKSNVPGYAKSKNQQNIVIERGGRKIVIDSDNGSILIEDSSGVKIDIDEKGVFIGNGTEDLLSVLKDLTQQLSIANVSGIPLSNAVAFTEINLRLSLFLK